MFRNLARDYSGVRLVSLATREEAIRESWLISLIAFASATLGFNVYVLLVESVMLEYRFWHLCLLLISSVYGVAINVLAPYFWAYRGKGTGWLKWWMIAMCPVQVMYFFMGISQVLPILNLSAILLIFGVILMYWINCWRLHKVNAHYKRYRKLTRFASGK